MDRVTQDQINVFSARGVLIEPQGPTWLWVTSVEHNVLYQYQLSGAENVLMGLIQTDTPYFQVSPPALVPFSSGLVLRTIRTVRTARLAPRPVRYRGVCEWLTPQLSMS
jgi:hypothetical protein